MPYHPDMPCRITDGPDYDDATPGLDSLDDDDGRWKAERHDDELDEERRLGRDKNGEDDDAFELRRTIKDIAGTDIPYLMKRQAGSE